MGRDLYHAISQFLEDSSFRSWVLTGVDEDGWIEWLETNPQHHSCVQEARNILLAMGGSRGDPDSMSTEAALADVLEHIHSLEQQPKRRQLSYRWGAAAAILLFITGLSWYFLTLPGSNSPRQSHSQVPSAPDWIDVDNMTTSPRIIALEDGSSVILQPGGRISYPVVFGSNSREVRLSGEAFFEITKNPARSFLVYTAELVTRVVGTSFRITAIDGQPHVEVFVKTGEVNVMQLSTGRDESAAEIALHPNEMVSFLKEEKVFEKSVIRETPKRPVEYLSFEFVDKPVGEILKAIETAYELTVEYPEQLLSNCYLSTSLTDEPLIEKLKIICASLGANTSYRLEADRIVIVSNGCN